jgi:hypothetical protein
MVLNFIRRDFGVIFCQETVQFIVLLPQFPRACFVHSRVKDMLVIGLKIKEKHVRARNMAIYIGCLKKRYENSTVHHTLS